MPNYREKISAAQKGIDSFYRLLNIYKLLKLNNGWIGTEEIPSDTSLSKFNTYLDDSGFKKPSDEVTATLFDIPMSSRGYDKYGRYGAGIPSDIGFTRNIEKNSEGINLLHESLYQVVNQDNDIELLASSNSDETVGGIIKYKIINRILNVYPNGSAVPIEIGHVDDDWDSNAYIFTIVPKENVNHLHMLYCFVIATNDVGLKLYVTTNFINWNIHQIIPKKLSSSDWGKFMDSYAKSSTPSNLQNELSKYFRVLPNNNYLIMEPYQLYDGTDKTTMVKMYSPYNKEPLLSIKDPYGTDEDYQDKAVKGFSSYMTENGEIVLYYNNRSETPMVLYNGRTMGTYEGSVSSNYKHEIIESSKVAKIYAAPVNINSPYDISVDDMMMDCAVNILESKNGKLLSDDIPSAHVNIALGDIGKHYQDNMKDSIGIYLNSAIAMMDNIDVDFSNYIVSENINGEKYLSGESDIQSIDIDWIEGTISDTDRNWYSICYGNDKFVAIVYKYNIFAYSYDSITWTEVTVSDTIRNWHSVCYGKDKFVAVASDSNIFAYSYDSITWTEVTVSDTRRQWYSVCYGNGIFVAVASDSNKFAYSTDGITWTEVTISETKRNWHSVCYGNGMFVAVTYDSNIFAYSYDGINWREGTISDSNRSWQSVCYGNDKFVAVARGSNIFAYSYDGINWTEGTISDTERIWRSICYGNGIFVAVADTSKIFAYSYDGITWRESTISDTERIWYSVCYSNDKFVAIAYKSNISASLNSASFYQRSIISNNNKLTILINPEAYRPNVRYRASIFGNTLLPGKKNEDSTAIIHSRLTNNPHI